MMCFGGGNEGGEVFTTAVLVGLGIEEGGRGRERYERVVARHNEGCFS